MLLYNPSLIIRFDILVGLTFTDMYTTEIGDKSLSDELGSFSDLINPIYPFKSSIRIFS